MRYVTMGKRSHRLPATALVAITMMTALGALRPHQASAAPTGPSARSVLIIMVDWTGNGVTPPAPQDSATAATAVSQVANTDTAWYLNASYGQFGGWTAAATGWYAIATPPLDSGSCVNAFRATIQGEANQAAQSAGYQLQSYSVIMYYFPWIPCGWAGWTINNLVWIDGSMNTPTTVHELGHTLGLGHGHSLVCVDSNGHAVALSGSCQTDEYGDPYDVMGSGPFDFTAIQKYDLGWMSNRELDVSTPGGTYNIAPLETAGATSVQALRLVDGSETLWLEFRQPNGIDGSLPMVAATGVLVHRQLADAYTALGSNLLDMTPGSTGGSVDAALPVGSTWTNPLGTDTITIKAANAAGARVTIGSTLTLVPDVLDDPTSVATSTIHSVGLSALVHQRVDSLCNNIGSVAAQSPSAGTFVQPGSVVDLWVGVRGPHPCP